jgi:hypothetical protein
MDVTLLAMIYDLAFVTAQNLDLTAPYDYYCVWHSGIQYIAKGKRLIPILLFLLHLFAIRWNRQLRTRGNYGSSVYNSLRVSCSKSWYRLTSECR